MQTLSLLPGKHKPIKGGHHWVFSGAVAHMPRNAHGQVVKVVSSEGEILGAGYLNTETTIAVRMLSFGHTDFEAQIEQNMISALALRQAVIDFKITNCFRWINGEGDAIPGLTVDVYDNLAVVQVSTLGMENLKDVWVQLLLKTSAELGLTINCIYEKSKIPSRSKEGMTDNLAVLHGQMPDTVNVMENGLWFTVNPVNSHKTGMYLDQREMRSLIGSLSQNRRVLNLCSYTGGFSLYALRGGATFVESVDLSKEVLKQAKENFELNGFVDESMYNFAAADVFDYLKRDESINFDIVILDPPAFAKKASDVPAAANAYTQLNKLALASMPSGSILVTCSCSYHIDPLMFEELIAKAISLSGKQVRILGKHRQAMDHVGNPSSYENEYLKSLVLWVC